MQVIPDWRTRGKARNDAQRHHVRLNLAYARALGSNGLALPDACFVVVLHSLYMIAQVELGLAYLTIF